MKKDIDKSIEELLEELDVPVDDNFDDLFYDDPLESEDNEIYNDLNALLS